MKKLIIAIALLSASSSAYADSSDYMFHERMHDHEYLYGNSDYNLHERMHDHGNLEYDLHDRVHDQAHDHYYQMNGY